VVETVRVERDGDVVVVTIDRPKVRNAVDRATADQLVAAFEAFDADDTASVVILTGAGGTFCAGADLRAIADGRGNRVEIDMTAPGPMGPTRMLLDKPVIAAVEGFAVAGGLELAAWCDLRVAARDAVFGVYCRRWGVPLIDGGTVRLPRLIGQSHALDLILTGRGVSGDEAVRMGLVNRICEPGAALAAALDLARQIAIHPQLCLRTDRRSAYEQWDLT
jgi:enoyl-CoA hydratase